MGRYRFEVLTDGKVNVEVGLFPTSGEAIYQGRSILLGYATATHPAIAYCTVARGSGEAAKTIGIWRYAQETAEPVWEAAQGDRTVLEFRTAARFVREAEAAETTARSLADPELRRAFEDLAHQWREMARRAGRPEDS